MFRVLLSVVLAALTLTPAAAQSNDPKKNTKEEWVGGPRPEIQPAKPPVTSFPSSYAKGTVIIDTRSRYLYVVKPAGKAMRFGIGVGRQGFRWRGEEKITRKAEWPAWHPPAEMREREPHLPVRMEGGPDNPLGARAMYLGNSLYRIHGTHQPWTIGEAVSSGCIRLRNEDVISLYDMVQVGAKVIVQ